MIAKRKSPTEQKIIGTSSPRTDIPAKVFAEQGFIHDLRPADMLFGDGVLNQIDNGMVQATSWTLQEAGRWDNGIMTAVDYGAYPIQDFVTTPSMASVVIDRPDQPSLGAGESSQGPAARPLPTPSSPRPVGGWPRYP